MLSTASQWGAYPDAPHALGYLKLTLHELVDEAEALYANVKGLRRLSDALDTKSFTSWLYFIRMNNLTTD